MKNNQELNVKPAALSGVGSMRLLDRWEVQQRCPLTGWQTWVIYDDQRHAETECARRIEESAPINKQNWRVAKRSNAALSGTERKP